MEIGKAKRIIQSNAGNESTQVELQKTLRRIQAVKKDIPTRVEVEYSEGKLFSITVDGRPIDVDCIRERPIEEWFEPLKGRYGWEGLVYEIRRVVANEKAELYFNFNSSSLSKPLLPKFPAIYDAMYS